MGNKFALKGKHSGTLLTQGGLIITHGNRKEMQFLFPSAEVVPCDAHDSECLPLKFARGMEAVEFPLNRKDFKDAS